MYIRHLKCVRCETIHPSEEIRYRCKSCGESLDVRYDYERIGRELSWETFRDRPFDHYRYREFLPIVSSENRINLHEGGTPLLPARRVGENIDLYFKMENVNPTGSFKDRGTCAELGRALDHGADQIVVASTGNMGSSIAAYTARAGVQAKIFVPEDVVTGPKFKHMSSHGAHLEYVEGGYQEAANRAWKEWEEKDVYLMGDYPYRGEGEKTMGFEIADRLFPEYVVLPIGNGTLIAAVWKSFKELETVGLIDQTPEMIGVQAEGCNPVVKAFQEDRDHVEAVEQADTIAGAIACEDPLDGEPALSALYESNGGAISVSEEEIREGKRLLAEKEGIYAEEAGAVALAGLIKEKHTFQDQTVVCAVTGHGLKT